MNPKNTFIQDKECVDLFILYFLKNIESSYNKLYLQILREVFN